MTTIEHIEKYKLRKECEQMSNDKIEAYISRTLIMTMQLHRNLNYFEDMYPTLYAKVQNELENKDV